MGNESTKKFWLMRMRESKILYNLQQKPISFPEAAFLLVSTKDADRKCALALGTKIEQKLAQNLAKL